jgi:hypothetical protein
MKIEFIKESKVTNLNPHYFTSIDGVYVSDSLRSNKEEAYIIYQKIVALQSNPVSTEVLESIEIDAEVKNVFSK